MTIEISSTGALAARAAAERAAGLLREALREALPSGRLVRFVAATGASQIEMLDRLCSAPDIDWSRTEMFHLDEYVGIPADHPASFRRYLVERLVGRVHPAKIHLLVGDALDPEAEAKRVGALIASAPVDVAFVGIGENGHLAFNDPPADFETTEPYLVLDLDPRCRAQQVGEGWFRSVEEVPERAISMSVRQILLSRSIVCTVPDRRKAEAVRACLSTGAKVSPLAPASILKRHERVFVYLDGDSASLLG